MLLCVITPFISIMIFQPSVSLQWARQPSLALRPSRRFLRKENSFPAIFLQGKVASGYGRGSAKLGFPTANLPYFDQQLKSSSVTNGVYAGWASVPEISGAIYPAVANIGYSPTFSGEVLDTNQLELKLIWIIGKQTSNC